MLAATFFSYFFHSVFPMDSCKMEAFSTGLLELLTDYQGFLEIVQLTIGKEFGAHEFLCEGPFPNCDVIDFMILTTVGWKPDKVKAVSLLPMHQRGCKHRRTV